MSLLEDRSSYINVSESVQDTDVGLREADSETESMKKAFQDMQHELGESGIPLSMWTECILTAANLINRLPSFVLDGKYPFELVYGFKPKLSHLRSFRCLCFSSILKNSNKFSASPNDEGGGFVTPTDDDNVHPCIRNFDVSEDDIATFIGDNSSYEGNVLSSSDPIAQRNLPENTGQVQLDVRRVYRFIQSKFDYSLFTKRSDTVFIALLVYVDDIVIIGNDKSEIENFKLFLKSRFQIKDLGKLKYFLGIEVSDNKDGICLSQRKYCLELLHEYGLLAAKHVDTPLPENTTLNYVETDDDHLLVNVGNYQRLVGSIRSGIQINKNGNLKLRAYANSDWTRCPTTRKSILSYCAENRSMDSATCEVIWLSNLLEDMGVKGLLLVVMYCDNSLALQIAASPFFYEKSKHFEIDVHLALDIEQHKTLCVKLGMLDMFKVEKLKGGC
ncbi:ribonuclease H-like domain-containing protein [Tanacetum coccineum]